MLMTLVWMALQALEATQNNTVVQHITILTFVDYSLALRESERRMVGN